MSKIELPIMPRPANPYGREYTWVVPNYSPFHERHYIGVQWLAFQGTEYLVWFDSAELKQSAMRKIHEYFFPEVPAWQYPRIADKHVRPHRAIWHVTLEDYTLYPDEMEIIIGKSDFVFTPMCVHWEWQPDPKREGWQVRVGDWAGKRTLKLFEPVVQSAKFASCYNYKEW